MVLSIEQATESYARKYETAPPQGGTVWALIKVLHETA
jgi:hypothetical protein